MPLRFRIDNEFYDYENKIEKEVILESKLQREMK